MKVFQDHYVHVRCTNKLMPKMTTYFLQISLLLMLLKPAYQISSVKSESYIGAVVEYHPVTNGENGRVVAEENANYYRTIIKSASDYNIDIIVFPEFGLTSLPKDGPRERQFNVTEYRAFYRDVASYIPSPNDTIIPCDDDANFKKSLRIISCAARRYKMYVVLNHHERAKCPEPNCPPDNFLLYNTNVVFDRNGKVVARYRKYNLFNEGGTNITAQPEHTTFTSDFGVTFGTFICFDILQEKPTTYFVRNPNVTDIVYSTHWFDELPFNDAVEQQAAWAYGANVNLLASGYSDAQTASGGSGIYAGKNGPIKVYQPHRTSNALIFAEVPKLKKGKRAKDLKRTQPTVIEFKDEQIATFSGKPYLGKDFPSPFQDDLRPYTTKLLGVSESCTTKLCDRGLCCDFEVKMKYDRRLVENSPGAKQYRYRLVAFNGVRSVANVMTAGIEVCALVACAGNRVEDCGSVYPSDTKVVYPTDILSVLITRRADLKERVFYEPSTLSIKQRLPLEMKDFNYIVSEHNETSLLLMNLDEPQLDLMTFGIYGRRYDRDGEKPTKLLTTKSKAGGCEDDKKDCGHSEL